MNASRDHERRIKKTKPLYYPYDYITFVMNRDSPLTLIHGIAYTFNKFYWI